MSSRSARMWNSRSPGVDGAVCTGPWIARERVQLRRPAARRQPVPQRAADADDAREPPAEIAEADVLDEVADRAERVADAREVLVASPAAMTRKIAERDSGASTLCASIGTRSHAPCSITRCSHGRGRSITVSASDRSTWPRHSASAIVSGS